MNVLVDTHVAAWWLDDPERLSPTARAALCDGRNHVHFSVGSIWEIGLKTARNKLRLPDGYVDVLQSDGFGLLDIRRSHVELAPCFHRITAIRSIASCWRRPASKISSS